MSSTTLRYAKHIFPSGKRVMSTALQRYNKTDLTILDIDDKTGVATISLNHPPVNALNLQLLTAILSDLERVQKDNARGLILTSFFNNIFSAGMDITKLHTTDKDFLKIFIGQIMEVIDTLHSYPIPVAAMINGHAYAGGCVLASCCEYRVMLPNYRMSVSEVLLGIVPPIWVKKPILEVLGRRNAEIALTQGKAYRTEEALKVGFIDEIATNKEEGLRKCHQFIDGFKGVNALARTATKRQFKYKLFVDKKAECEEFVNYITQQHVQESIEAYLKRLPGNSKI